MGAISTAAAVAAVSLGLGLAVTTAGAQEAKQPISPNPVGAASPWSSTVALDPVPAGQSLDDKQVATVKKVNAYFNELGALKGLFLQTDPDRKQFKGKFYVKRPGRFRFDYGAPSKKVVVSDGQYLAIQDLDLGNEDVLELDNTPFRLILRNDVDLLRDARILDVQEREDAIIVSLQDKSPDAPGRITLHLTKRSTLDLKEWVTTDAQGLDTRVELSDLVRPDDLDPALFKREILIFRKLQ
jgi:outer membrane lipoprotein-sorting protein